MPLPSTSGSEIYVASANGAAEAISFVQISDLVPGTDPAVHLTQATDSLAVTTASLAACLATAPVPHDGELTAQETPGMDCKVRVALESAGLDSWLIPLSLFEPFWGTTRVLNLALVPDSVGTDAFRIAFDTTQSTATVADLPPSPLPALAPVQQPQEGPVPPLMPNVTQPPLQPSGIPSPALPVAVAPLHEVPDAPIAATTMSNPDHPGWWLAPVIGLGVGLALWRRRTYASTHGWSHRHAVRVTGLLVCVAAACTPLLGSEATVYKAGLVCIFLVSALGLHVLVNWAGELSLAQAGMVGFPAFAVASLSAEHQISPILLLPLAVACGAGLGALVGLPAIRARGVQVALVTLVAGIAIDRFFFAQGWLVGAAGDRGAADPTLGPLRLTSSRGLYPLLLAITALSLLVAWQLNNSRLARAWYRVREEPMSASAYGIPVTSYRVLAYAVGGAFAGLSGGLTAMWVRHLTAQAFPTTMSFEYLAATVLAGHGSIAGVVVSSLAVAGGHFASPRLAELTAFIAPLTLIFVLTRQRAGLNGAIRSVGRMLNRETAMPDVADKPQPAPVDMRAPLGITSGSRSHLGWRGVVGWALAACGFVSIVLAWYHSGNSDQVWIQNQQIVSGGIGGIGLILLGGVLVIADHLTALTLVTQAARAPLAAPEPADVPDFDHDPRYQVLTSKPVPAAVVAPTSGAARRPSRRIAASQEQKA